jgi:transcriptional regulator with XRE-family HTH domain
MTRLQEERRRRGWTQLDLAYHARVQPSEISKIENGRLRPYPGQLARLARVLGVIEPDALLEDADRQPVSA